MNEPTLRETFLAFRNDCEWIQVCFNTNRSLFGTSEPRRQMLGRVAPAFFGELNRILIENFFLKVCAISDPAKSNGQANLTVSYLNQQLDIENLLTPAILQATQGIDAYRKLVVVARNKLIAHSDMALKLSYQPLGEHTVKDVESFFSNLYVYVDEVGIAVGVGPLDFSTTSGPGDVDDLFRALNEGVYLS